MKDAEAMKICKRMGAAHAERRKFRKREDRLRVTDPW